MDDLISRKALVENLSNRYMSEVFPDWRELPQAIKEAVGKLGSTFKQTILNAPVVDAVAVVRCKECKYSELCIETNQRVWCLKQGMSKANEWYCADGERKEDA